MMKDRTVTELNHLSRCEFVRTVGPVFEHSPWIAEAAWPTSASQIRCRLW